MVHELGHISTAIYYRWHIEKVILLPFGGLTIFNEKINRPLKEEFMVLIMGPVFQMLGTIIFCGFSKDFLVADYSKMILAFNLLPIYPLDGAKLLNITSLHLLKGHMFQLFMFHYLPFVRFYLV